MKTHDEIKTDILEKIETERSKRKNRKLLVIAAAAMLILSAVLISAFALSGRDVIEKNAETEKHSDIPSAPDQETGKSVYINPEPLPEEAVVVSISGSGGSLDTLGWLVFDGVLYVQDSGLTEEEIAESFVSVFAEKPDVSEAQTSIFTVHFKGESKPGLIGLSLDNGGKIYLSPDDYSSAADEEGVVRLASGMIRYGENGKCEVMEYDSFYKTGVCVTEIEFFNKIG